MRRSDARRTFLCNAVGALALGFVAAFSLVVEEYVVAIIAGVALVPCLIIAGLVAVGLDHPQVTLGTMVRQFFTSPDRNYYIGGVLFAVSAFMVTIFANRFISPMSWLSTLIG